MTTLMILGGVAAFGLGIWIGIGHPGLPGREDRILPGNMRRRPLYKQEFLDWLKPRKR